MRKKASNGLVLTAANFLATESAQCLESWHHRMRLVETISTVCRMSALPSMSALTHPLNARCKVGSTKVAV